MTAPTSKRRRFQFGAAALALSILATGCGAPAGSGADDEVTLRFAWWGNEYLNGQTEKVIAAFEAEHPNINIESEPGEWGSYWDKLATKTAANDAPDVIQMDQKYIAEYGGRGALLDLSTADGIDMSKLDEEALASGQYDGAQYGLSTGQNAYVIMANTKVFEAANVPIPDDSSWTWDDFMQTASQISSAGDGKTYGAAYGSNEADLIIWLRQHGENLYSEDGKLDFDTATAASGSVWRSSATPRRAPRPRLPPRTPAPAWRKACSAPTEWAWPGGGPTNSVHWSPPRAAASRCSGHQAATGRRPRTACTTSPPCSGPHPPGRSTRRKRPRSSTTCPTARRPAPS